ncbi:MAG: adenylate/guanylate cyclase domain-containing protein [Campylobacterota bacterium]|nr:adenylate/guanylate cyclase domain-containing protein [Campylobacterota bacterium]
MLNFIKSYTRFWLHLLSFTILSSLMIFAYLALPKYYEHTDSILRDYIFQLRGVEKTSGNIVILDIDEKSLKEYGQWPWSRNIIAELLTNATEAGAGIIGLDMVFAEEDTRSPHTIASALHVDASTLPNYDVVLGEAFASLPIIGGFFFTNELIDSDETPTLGAIYIEKGGTSEDFSINFNSIVMNIPLLQDSLYSSGFFNTIPDKDGSIRSVPILMRQKDGFLYPSLVLEMYRTYLDIGKVVVDRFDSGIDGISLGDIYIPTDRFGRLLVNYRGGTKTFEYVSAKDVLTKSGDIGKLKDKFVLLGTSAIGLVDIRPTPFDSAMPGVEVHANALDNLLMNDFITSTYFEESIQLLFILTLIALSVILFSIVSEYLVLPLLFGVLYALYYLFSTMMFEYHIVVNIIIPLISVIITFITTVAIDFILTASQKKVVMQAFSKKVSPAVMEDLIKHNAKGLLEPVEKEVSIFFSDIRSFTTISEKIGSPHKLIKLLNEYMTPMVDIIIDEKGTVDKFIGDAIMAYWNAPVEITNHADHALISAIKQIEKLNEIRSDIVSRYGIELHIGIGINSGEVTVGDMGSDGRSDYTIIGDHVNLASRLEGLTKNYGAQIVISSFAKDKLVQSYKIRSLDFVKVKGKDDAVEIFEVVVDDKISLEEMKRYEEAMLFYRDAKIIEAHEIFKELEQNSASFLYNMYIERCQHYINNPELEFDLTLTMTTK